MTLYIIGLGLCNEKDLTLKAVEILKTCDIVYFENYTSKISIPVSSYESVIGKKIILADRELIEQKAEKEIVEKAKTKNVAVIVPGDAFAATTHNDLMIMARLKNVSCEVVLNASIITAVAITGLQIYKFGKTTSIPLHNENVESPYDVLKENQSIGAHTLFLLEYDPITQEFVSVNKAIHFLLNVEKKRKENIFSKKTLCVGVARLGCSEQVIRSGSAEQLLKKDFGDAPHCLIVAGKLHFKEEEGLKVWK